MNYNGEERRKVSQDSIERDRLLTRLDANVEFLVQGQKNTTQALVDHAKNDDIRFNKMDSDLEDLKRFKWKQAGAVGGFLIALEVALKTLFK